MKNGIFWLLLLTTNLFSCNTRNYNKGDINSVAIVRPPESKLRLFWLDNPGATRTVQSGFCGSGFTSEPESLRPSDCQSNLKSVTYDSFLENLKSQIALYKKNHFANIVLSEEAVQKQKFLVLIDKLKGEVQNPNLGADIRQTAALNITLAEAWMARLKPDERDPRLELIQTSQNAEELSQTIEKSLSRKLPIKYSYGSPEPMSAQGMIALLIWNSFDTAYEAAHPPQSLDYSQPLGQYVLTRPLKLHIASPISFAQKGTQLTTPRFVTTLPYVLFGKNKIFRKGPGVYIPNIDIVYGNFSHGLVVGEPFCKMEIPVTKNDTGYEISFRHRVVGDYLFSPTNDADTAGLVFMRTQMKPSTQKDFAEDEIADVFFLRCGILSEDSLTRVAGDANLDLLDFFGTFVEKRAAQVFTIGHLNEAMSSQWVRLNMSGSENAKQELP